MITDYHSCENCGCVVDVSKLIELEEKKDENNMIKNIGITVIYI
jgi:hypothetical protein